MPEDFCSPFEQCRNLDGRILINQTLQGPALALPSDVSIADISGKALLRPYCRFGYLARWIPQQACKAPVRSIIGLAPSETMTLETRQVEQVDFTRLVQDALETSEVVTTSGPPSYARDREGGDVSDSIWFQDRRIAEFGSFWEDVCTAGGAFVGAVLGGPAGAAVGAWVGNTVGEWLGGSNDGGPGTGNSEVQDVVDGVLESVTRAESRRMVTETSTSRTRAFERTVARTFVNPYRDRSLELRLIPVFRHFQVLTTLLQFQHGLVLELVTPRFNKQILSARLGDFIHRHLVDPRIVSIASSELGLQEEFQVQKEPRAKSPLTEHLNANAEFYAKRYLRYLHVRRDSDALQDAMCSAIAQAIDKKKDNSEFQKALVWSRTQVQDKAIYVPLAGGHVATKALNMQKSEKAYLEALNRIEEFRLHPMIRKHDVHLFMGTHIEAAAGECILQNIP